MEEILLDIEDLKVRFTTERGIVRAVDGISLQVRKGKTLCLVGESGCGKSVTALSIPRLLPVPPAQVSAERMDWKGRELTKLSKAELRNIRGAEIAMIFQEPMTSLNPVFTVGNQIIEAIRTHMDLSKQQARERAIELLTRVGIPAPEKRVDEYPHSLSGGMRQRVMIAMALSCDPELLIADEPTTALDVTIQAQILELLRKLGKDTGLGLLLITHDLGVVAEMADEVAVMYAGNIVEKASVSELFSKPAHPYTNGLLAGLPTVGGTARTERLKSIPGMVPDLIAPIAGCPFADRCEKVAAECREHPPEAKTVGPDHIVRCYRPH